MRIGDLNAPALNPVVSPAGETQTEHAPFAAREDVVELSKLSEAVAAEGAGSAGIEQLRAQVRAGTYAPPADEVAKSVVRFYGG